MARREDISFNKARINKLYLGDENGLLGTIVPYNTVFFERYTLEQFESDPVCTKKAGGAPGAATGDENAMCLGKNMFEYHILGAGQTITAPSIVATGLLVSLDKVNDEGAEYSQGILARSKQAFVVGTDAFYFKLKFSIADVSGADEVAVGFRKAEAYQANIDAYADMATLNVISGDITIETIIGDAATVPTDTTDDWANGATKTLEVYVSKAGVVTYKVDGAAPTTVAAYTFTDALTVVPFFHLLHAATTPGDVILKEWECGLQ